MMPSQIKAKMTAAAKLFKGWFCCFMHSEKNFNESENNYLLVGPVITSLVQSLTLPGHLKTIKCVLM